MTAEERLTVRKELVAPKIDAFFSYIHSLESADDIFSDRMKKAIQYAVNQESRLRLFLTDGNIPCDNGFCLSAGITYPHLLPEGRINTASTAKRCA
jgi:hypothetical protein